MSKKNSFKSKDDIRVVLGCGKGSYSACGFLKVYAYEDNKMKKPLFTYEHNPDEADECLVFIQSEGNKKYFSFYTGGPKSFWCWSVGTKIETFKGKKPTLDNSWLMESEMVFTSKKVEFVMPKK